MARRIRLPLTTMVLGAVAAWVLLVVVSVYNPVVFEPRVLVAGGAIGAAAAVIIELLLSWRAPRSTVTVAGEAERQQAALDAQAASFARQQLELARDLQQRLLPAPQLETEAYRVVARNVPAAYVAGDFYDFVPLSDGRLLIVIADVAGKGVGAGLIMATVKAMIPLIAAEQSGVAPLVGRLNERLAAQITRREFVAIVLAIYDPRHGSLAIANAGLPDPLLVREDDVRPLVVGGPRYPLGIRRSLAYESITTRVQAGDRVLFFTDGLPETTVAGEPLGYERLTAHVKQTRGDVAALFAALESAGATHDDDWTAVVLESLRPRGGGERGLENAHASGATSSAAAVGLLSDVT